MNTAEVFAAVMGGDVSEAQAAIDAAMAGDPFPIQRYGVCLLAGRDPAEVIAQAEVIGRDLFAMYGDQS